MISLKELNPKGFPLSPEQEANLQLLHSRINIIRSKWGKPMMVTSGFRSLDDHKRIYMEIGKKKGIGNVRIPMGSQHLKGAAVDIFDQDGSLMQWCRENEAVLVEAKLWCEDDPSTPRVHFQIFPPASGNRFFKP